MNAPVDFLIISGNCTPDGMGADTLIRTLGPHKIADIARKHGYSSVVISRNEKFTFSDFLEVCEPLVNKDTVIGISTTFILTWFDVAGKSKDSNQQNQYVDALRSLVSHFKAKYGTKVVLGGPNANWYMDALGADDYIRGYAEIEIPAYLNKIKNNGLSKKLLSPWSIQSCDFRWDKSDCIAPGETLPLELSRGCIFKCQFCTYELIGKRKGTYERDLNLIREELIHNYNEFGVTSYSLTSDTFNDNDERMNDWCDMLETLPFNITYTGFARLDLMSRFESTSRRLYQSGLVGCQFGIETFHPEASKTIGKGFHGKQGKEALEHLFYNVFDENIVLFGTMIVGLPHEPVESYHESSKWFRDNPWFAVKWNPLFLVNNQGLNDGEVDSVGHVSNSEFSRDAIKYGYRFPDPDNQQYWETDIMDFKQARILAEELKSTISLSERMTNWEAINYIGKFGVTARDIVSEGRRAIVSKHRGDLYTDYYYNHKKRILKYISDSKGSSI
jgi:hypothetical protein